MNTDFLTLDKGHPLGESATGCSRGFRSHATCLRNGTRLQAGMRPAGVIAHFSGPLSVKRGFQTTCCLPAKRQSLARDCSCPTGLRVLFLVVECSPRPRHPLQGAYSLVSEYRYAGTQHVAARKRATCRTNSVLAPCFTLDREPEKCTLAVRMFACKRTPLRLWMACHPNSPLHLTPVQLPFLGLITH